MLTENPLLVFPDACFSGRDAFVLVLRCFLAGALPKFGCLVSDPLKETFLLVSDSLNLQSS